MAPRDLDCRFLQRLHCSRLPRAASLVCLLRSRASASAGKITAIWRDGSLARARPGVYRLARPSLYLTTLPRVPSLLEGTPAVSRTGCRTTALSGGRQGLRIQPRTVSLGTMSSRGVAIGLTYGRRLTRQVCCNLDLELANERDLVRDMLAGEERAFRTFFDSYFPRVYRFAVPRLGGDAEASKEVVQATLVKAIRNLHSYRGEAALFSWVCQICRHQIVDYLRANRRHDESVVLIDDSKEVRAALESVEAPEEDEPMQQYSSAETRRLVQSILDRLPPRYGDVLEWKYIEGRSVEEIGELLGVGHTAAQSLLARARTAFRAALDTVFGSTAADVLVAMRGGG